MYRLAAAANEVDPEDRTFTGNLDISAPGRDPVATPVTSVGSPVSDDPRYDVHIVRHAES